MSLESTVASMDAECSLCCLATGVAILAVIALLVLAVILYVTTEHKWAQVKRFDTEHTFVNTESKDRMKFPWNSEQPLEGVSLSVVVPSYNEEERLPIMLDEALDYLEARQKQDGSFSYEIIVVDDGSKDKTSEVAQGYQKLLGCNKLRVLTLKRNRGKGGAVRMGVLSSRGGKILFVDADGATKFADLEFVEESMDALEGGKEGMALAVGSRAHLEDAALAERSFFRNLLMHGFHFLVYTLCVKDVKDTQCGFKLFTRKAAVKLFTALHVERWAFDVELLYIAQRLGIPIAERGVNWQEIDGSKMVPIFSWIEMGRDLLFIRMRYVLSLWKINIDQLHTLEME